MAGFAVLDFETTGSVPERTDRVVEVGVVLLDADGRREESWTTLVNPRRDIGATHIHGISAQHVLDAPEFPDISDQLLSLVSGRTLVAHNAAFDMRFLHQELLRAGYGITDRPDALCSMKWSKTTPWCREAAALLRGTGIPSRTRTPRSATQRLPRSSSRISCSSAAPSAHGRTMSPYRAATRGPTNSAGELPARLHAPQTSPQCPAPGWRVFSPVPGCRMQQRTSPRILPPSKMHCSIQNISVTEGRALVEIAAAAGVTPERMLELHRAHLGSWPQKPGPTGYSPIPNWPSSEVPQPQWASPPATLLPRSMHIAKRVPARQQLCCNPATALSLPESWCDRVTSGLRRSFPLACQPAGSPRRHASLLRLTRIP